MYLSPTSELAMIQAKTGYKFDPPTSKHNKIYYLEVVQPLRWEKSESKISHSLIPVGSLTWAYNYTEEGNIHPEDNKLCANVDAKCFRLIKVESYSDDSPQMVDTSLYRFKTKVEFIKEGRWINRESGGHPEYWAHDGSMNKYLGQLVSPHGHEAIKLSKESGRTDVISFDGWTFKESNFIGKDVISPTKEMPGVERMSPSFREQRIPEVRMPSLQPVQRADWVDVAAKTSPVPTFRHPDYISHGTTKENLTDDIVIESTINITI